MTSEGHIYRTVSQYVVFNCLLSGAEDLTLTGSHAVYRQLVFALCFPVLFTAWLTVIFLFVSAIKGSWTQVNEQYKCSILIMLWLVQPDICHIVFASFSCVSIEGEQRLFRDPEIICWEGSHLNNIIYWAIPGFLIYIIGLPLFLLDKLRKNKGLI